MATPCRLVLWEAGTAPLAAREQSVSHALVEARAQSRHSDGSVFVAVQCFKGTGARRRTSRETVFRCTRGRCSFDGSTLQMALGKGR